MPTWDTLLTNVNLATMVEGEIAYGAIADGALAIAGDRIAWVGAAAELPRRDAATIVDGKGGWLTPGLIDCHTHLVFAGDRSGEFEQRLQGASYEAIARGGRDAFYRGPVAERIVAFSREHGGFFAPADFASHTSDWVEPISTTYRGVTVWEIPPPGQGLAALQMLSILETFDLRAMGRDSAALWHTMIEAKKLVFEDRARYYADPAFARVPVASLLSKDYARARAAKIDPTRQRSGTCL